LRIRKGVRKTGRKQSGDQQGKDKEEAEDH
jgi:hypothetical protein